MNGPLRGPANAGCGLGAAGVARGACGAREAAPRELRNLSRECEVQAGGCGARSGMCVRQRARGIAGEPGELSADPFPEGALTPALTHLIPSAATPMIGPVDLQSDRASMLVPVAR